MSNRLSSVPLGIVGVQAIVSSVGNNHIKVSLAGHDEDGYPVKFFVTIHHNGDITEFAEVLRSNIEPEEDEGDEDDWW